MDDLRPIAELSDDALHAVATGDTTPLTRKREALSEIARQRGTGVSVPPSPQTRAVIVGFDVPFWDLVKALVKISLASIPAAFIVAVIAVIVGVVFGGVLRGLFSTP